MKIRVALVTACAFPIGGPETNRFMTYCKAFSEREIYSKVYILLPTENSENIINSAKCGQFEGVYFQYISSIIKPSKKSRFRKGLFLFFNILKTFCKLKQDNINVIILYWGASFVVYTMFCVFAKLYRITFLIDRGEYPFKRKSLTLFQSLKEKFIFKYFDGLIVMAHNLIPFYKNIKRRNAEIFHLPMTVDFDRFKNYYNQNKIFENEYICCVFGIHNRDCIIDTIRAYKYYHDVYKTKSYELWLIGDAEKLPVYNDVLSIIKEFNLQKKILIKGVLPSNYLPKILVNSKAVITTARSYNSGGFPSKIGEYLASKSPVIVTSAGELSYYLKDKINALVAPPADIIEISNRIIYLHSNTNECKKIAEMGYDTAKLFFDVHVYIDDLIKFIIDLSRK